MLLDVDGSEAAPVGVVGIKLQVPFGCRPKGDAKGNRHGELKFGGGDPAAGRVKPAEWLLLEFGVAFHINRRRAAESCAERNLLVRLPEQTQIVTRAPTVSLEAEEIGQGLLGAEEALLHLQVGIVYHRAGGDGEAGRQLESHYRVDRRIH